MNQGLAPNSRKLISHASPEAVPFSTRAPSLLFVVVIVLQQYLQSRTLLSLAVFILDRLHRLRWPSPLPRLRFLLPRATCILPRSPFRLVAFFLVSDQRHGPPSHNGYPRRHIHIRIPIPIPLLASAARRRSVSADVRPFDPPVPADPLNPHHHRRHEAQCPQRCAHHDAAS